MVRLPPLPLPLALFVREAALAAIWRRFAALRCSWPAPVLANHRQLTHQSDFPNKQRAVEGEGCDSGVKVFCFFSSEKKCLLTSGQKRGARLSPGALFLCRAGALLGVLGALGVRLGGAVVRLGRVAVGFGGVGVGCLVVTLVVVLGGRLVGLGCLLVVFGGLVMCGLGHV